MDCQTPFEVFWSSIWSISYNRRNDVRPTPAGCAGRVAPEPRCGAPFSSVTVFSPRECAALGPVDFDTLSNCSTELVSTTKVGYNKCGLCAQNHDPYAGRFG